MANDYAERSKGCKPEMPSSRFKNAEPVKCCTAEMRNKRKADFQVFSLNAIDQLKIEPPRR